MSIDLPGFADPVRGAQTTFRAILDALSHPGAVHRAGADLIPPEPLGPAAAAALLTLVDADTPIWIAPAFAPARDWISFHCGAPIAEDVSGADFVLTDEMPSLDSLNAGSDEAPEESATLILQVSGLSDGRRMHLAGPGLRTPEAVTIDGLPDTFVASWEKNHTLFPRGVDILLCAGDELVALPRGVAITEA